MTTPKPTEIIELWICRNGCWEAFENFDPSSPQFARSAAPAEYAFFEARRQGVRLVKAERGIQAYRVRRTGHSNERERGR